MGTRTNFLCSSSRHFMISGCFNTGLVLCGFIFRFKLAILLSTFSKTLVIQKFMCSTVRFLCLAIILLAHVERPVVISSLHFFQFIVFGSRKLGPLAKSWRSFWFWMMRKSPVTIWSWLLSIKGELWHSHSLIPVPYESVSFESIAFTVSL